MAILFCYLICKSENGCFTLCQQVETKPNKHTMTELQKALLLIVRNHLSEFLTNDKIDDLSPESKATFLANQFNCYLILQRMLESEETQP